MTRISIGVSLDLKFVSLIDSKRGDVPRSRFIEKILSENIDNKTC